jgi:uncharacterized membrane protein (DUF2068 family)
LVLIGLFKLAKVVVLLVAGIGGLVLTQNDIVHDTRAWAGALGFDVGDHHLQALVRKLGILGPRQRHELVAGCLVYATLFAIEGVGLLARRLWAVYLTIAITASFIPLEIYELARGKSVLKGVVIVLNVAIVVFLILRLRRNKEWPFG